MSPTKAIVVGVGECRASCDPASHLVTYALGSCIAVALYDPAAQAGAMLHFLLPDSAMDRDKAALQPALFADTGIALLVDAWKAMGAGRGRAKVMLAGGAQMTGAGDTMNIGKRNHLAARKALWKLGLLIDGETVGGAVARNFSLAIGTGEFEVRTKS